MTGVDRLLLNLQIRELSKIVELLSYMVILFVTWTIEPPLASSKITIICSA